MNNRSPLHAASLPLLFGAVKVGERGQVVIPQAARAKMGIKPGDQLLAMGGFPGGEGLMLIKAESFSVLMGEFTEKIRQLEKLFKITDAEGAIPAREASKKKAPVKKTARSRT